MPLICFVCTYALAIGQSDLWNGKKCAVVLTYDDALDVHLDNVLPVLDEMDLKATFYTPAWDMRDRLDEWRRAAQNGHELGNHTLYHPCTGSFPRRDWVNEAKDLDHYTVETIVREIRMANVFLNALDGKDERTFAYTCGDTEVGGESFVEKISEDFVAARGVHYGLEQPEQVQLMDVKTFTVVDNTAEELIAEVKKAEASGTLITFLFHGVGGGHSMNVDNTAHIELLHYLKSKKDVIWIATMLELAVFLRG